jgi:hypothetical protein
MVDIAAGKKSAKALDSVINLIDSTFKPNALQLYFTSNHDENSHNKADYGTMPGPSHAPFAVLTQTIGRSVPLIYSGQEEPFLDSLSFFYKDTISFNKLARAPFYKTLLMLRKDNDALAANATFTKLVTNKDDEVYAYLRQNEDKKVLVLLNLTKAPQSFTIANFEFQGAVVDVFKNKSDQLKKNQSFQLPAWGYLVYSYK